MLLRELSETDFEDCADIARAAFRAVRSDRVLASARSNRAFAALVSVGQSGEFAVLHVALEDANTEDVQWLNTFLAVALLDQNPRCSGVVSRTPDGGPFVHYALDRAAAPALVRAPDGSVREIAPTDSSWALAVSTSRSKEPGFEFVD